MTLDLSRRSAAGLIAGAALAPLIAPAARAGRVLDLRASGGFQPVAVAVAPFAGDEAARTLTSVIVNNFNRSVFLRPIEPGGRPEQAAASDGAPELDLYRSLGAQYVVTGRAQRGPDGRLKTEFRLFDVATGEQAAGQQYVTEAAFARRVAHLVSDAVFTRITGEKGFFDTRVVFVDESGPKERRRKRLAIMDQDGANVRYLSRGDDLVVTPRFSPSSQDVTYMSFGAGDPKVLLLSIESGQREVVGNFPGMTFAPRFSPDGQKIVMSLSQGASTNLYAMDLRSRTTTRLTDTNAIDTSPSYSPSGAEIVFESDRGGSQQIYVMSANGGGARRISFGPGHYSTPVWSPKGDYIAFTRQSSGAFGIGVMKPDGSGERILTEGFHNEGPTWAPNGLFLMFFREPGGQSGAKIHMVDVFGRSEFPVPTPSYASDPSWGPLQD
ncbi:MULTISPECIES: Tol-Pal system beta propeller repeat protein TolB [Methylosinus]|uniref:Tol-Pal system protein TolB n=1 Tax=Methylosinus trichosporium (strain ATCC 35070 / NCIMB 11131 / UNIQEM 75 / OB3b) TaxID=595536 RepID=A0A2D2CV08_METT3|nr:MULTISPECIES: Tol-Pal system beta propeller repeat protein TolB [Methylosinus]ATQ66573.1 Tol-Pal system beta propeller repeat protein TolB [Methylosinus trichosporium OB3b]OBS54464.1 Tol-Pal system beta propeller repeat protein TolB [Methylosinus sp. 3S-1]